MRSLIEIINRNFILYLLSHRFIKYKEFIRKKVNLNTIADINY